MQVRRDGDFHDPRTSYKFFNYNRLQIYDGLEILSVADLVRCGREERLEFPQCFPQRSASLVVGQRTSNSAQNQPKTEVFWSFTRKLPRREFLHLLQIARGPRNSRTGNKNIALINPRTPCTAIPMIRNGSVSSHTMGYSTSASSASGQHSTNRIIHRRNAAIATSLFLNAGRSILSAAAARPALNLHYETLCRKVPFTAKSLRRRLLAMDAGTSASSRMCESSTSE